MFDTYITNQQGQDDIRTAKTVLNNACGLAMSMMPEGEAKKNFVTHMETAVFYGTKSIASKPENHTDVIKYSGGKI